ncbi:TonB-dependent receptor plug domain-containing protein [Methylomarinum vadi]|uniref:TonB-dependent receptor plug domain-containing protein n=1 Tax=Methylomarinum vadi TaxID=438855 RepID=UPI00068D96D9|nr:TonB-dependent receptor [Methylomarinum vadi]
MKSKNYIVPPLLLVPLTLLAPSAVCAEEPIELESMEIEGEIIRPNMTGVLPEQGGLNDAARLLKSVPGGNVNGLGPLSGIAQYRGLYGDRVNVDFKGMNYKPACTNSMDAPLSHVPAAMTSLLKIYRGIAPVSSGIETIGGAIVQETKRPAFTEAGELVDWTGKFSSGFNSNNDGWYGALYSGLATEHHRFHAYGSKEFGQDYEYPGGANVPTEHDREAAELGYGFRYKEHIVDMDFNYNHTRPTGTPALPMDITVSEGGIFTTSYQGKVFDDIGIKASYNYQDIRHTMDNYTLRQPPKTGKRISTNYSDGFGYKLAIDFPLLSGIMLVGADGDNANHDALVTNPDQAAFFVNNFNGAQRDRYGFFAEWTVSPLEDFEVELGARVNHIEMDTGVVSTSMTTSAPSPAMQANWSKLVNDFNSANRSKTDFNYDLTAVLRYDVTEELQVEVGFARKTRSPSYQERYLWAPFEATGGLADGYLYIGDINLQPEKSYQGELGFTWRSGSFYFSPRAFYRYIDDYIQGLPTSNATAAAIATALYKNSNRAGLPLLQFTNIDAILYGTDLEAGFRVMENWRVDGILSYVNGDRADQKDNLYRIAPLNGQLSLFYDTAKWSVGSEIVGYWRQGEVSKFNNEPKTAGYVLWNIRGQAELYKGLQFGVGVENLLDKEYRVHLNGLNRSLNNVDNGTDIGQRLPGIGRNVYVTLNYEW